MGGVIEKSTSAAVGRLCQGESAPGHRDGDDVENAKQITDRGEIHEVRNSSSSGSSSCWRQKDSSDSHRT